MSDAASKPERRYELRFLDSANFKPFGPNVEAELRLTVGSKRKQHTIAAALGEGWGLAEVSRVQR